MNFFGFGPSAEVEIELCGQDTRKTAEIKTEDGKKDRHLLYYDGETVSGKVNIQLKKPGSRLDHYGIKIELIGQIELYYDRGNHHDFLSLVKELARPGDLFQHTTYNFEFVNVEKPYEAYTGSNVKLRYFLRLTIVRRLTDIVKEKEIIVHTLSSYPEMNSSIKMEVGIEDCLHIEFEYNKSKYHLKDVIVGKIYFLLVRIKIKHMEIAIIKRETTGTGPNTFNENETIAKYEIMDGAPVRGESIPIRVFLAGYDLTPTMKDINKKFSVRYYLNLVLVDEEDRRYFKQQEIILWRKGEKTRKPFQAALQQQYKQMQNPNIAFSTSEHSLAVEANAVDIGGNGENLHVGDDDKRIRSGKSRSPLEETPTQSEHPTPDKEFQSVINSRDPNTTNSTTNNTDHNNEIESGEEIRKIKPKPQKITDNPPAPEPPTINPINNSIPTSTTTIANSNKNNENEQLEKEEKEPAIATDTENNKEQQNSNNDIDVKKDEQKEEVTTSLKAAENADKPAAATTTTTTAENSTTKANSNKNKNSNKKGKKKVQSAESDKTESDNKQQQEPEATTS